MDQDDNIGKTVEGYRIIKSLGSGQFSTVYHAENKEKNFHCALKIVKIFDMMDESERAKCLGEVKFLQSVNHPGIVKYLDSFIADNKLFIAIEWADKGDLKKLIRKHEQEKEKIDDTKIFDYLKILSSALVHMHSKRIMHRDLKPANILYFSEGVKVGDLGLGRYMSDSTCMAYSKVGTPYYMAPEVMRNTGYGFNSDIWSLGCVLYEMITFRSPFRTDEKIHITKLFQNINKAEYKKLDETVCPELRYLVDNMLQADPDKRIDLNHIITVCDTFLNKSKHKTKKVDCFTIAEDIFEKLRLINFQTNFQIPLKFTSFHKYYFALPSAKGEESQFARFCELVLWILHLIKNKISISLINKEINFRSIFSALENGSNNQEKLALFLSTQIQEVVGLDIGGNIDFAEGFGDWCVVILSQILDKYLIEQNFSFAQPNYSKYKKESNTEIANGGVPDFNSSLVNRPGGKGYKFNKDKIMEKLGRLDNKKLDNDYEFFSTRIFNQAKPNTAFSHSHNNSQRDYKNEKYISPTIRVNEDINSKAIDRQTELVFDSIYDSASNTNKKRKYSTIDIKSSLLELQTRNNSITESNQKLKVMFDTLILDSEEKAQKVSNLESHLFRDPTIFSAYKDKILLFKSSQKELQLSLAEKKQSTSMKEKKRLKISNNLDSLLSKINELEENLNQPKHAKLAEGIAKLKKEIGVLDLKNAIFNMNTTNMLALKKKLEEENVFKSSEFKGGLVNYKIMDEINEFNENNKDNEFDEFL
mmetsp:Transcript_15743/g.16336  ORF Transcript_15743/g.16336 Transcript_15743/m.16336 type:complete len:759 (+) Transcript_15743:15-2291(+)